MKNEMANQTTTSHLVYPNTYLTFKDEMDAKEHCWRWNIYLNGEYTDCYLWKLSDKHYSVDKKTSTGSKGLQMWKLDTNPINDKKFAYEVYEWIQMYEHE